jgi:uncharacterized membrane protein
MKFIVRLGCMLSLFFAPAIVRAAAVVTDHEISAILSARCAACHSEHPTLMSSPPKGLTFASPVTIDQHAHAIYRQVVELRAMPVGNVTNMTDAERQAIALWFNDRSSSHPTKAEGTRLH